MSGLPPGFKWDDEPSGLPPGFKWDDEPAPVAQAGASVEPALPASPPPAPMVAAGLSDAPQGMDVSAGGAVAPADEARVAKASLQGAGRGVVNLAMLPADIQRMGLNLQLFAGDNLLKLAGAPGINFRLPMASEGLANTAADIGKLIGYDAITPETPREKLAYNVAQLGTESAGGSVALGRAAAARAATRTAESVPGMLDRLLTPYMNAPGKMLAGDTIAGAGAGTDRKSVV